MTPQTPSTTPATWLPTFKPGDHVCGLYRTNVDQERMAVDFVRAGIDRGEKIFYIVAAHTAVTLKATLTAGGIDVEEFIKKNQLVLLTAKESYLHQGEFVPNKMIDLLVDEENKAIAAGYSAVRLTGEMSWTLAGEPGSERFIEYEALLNQWYPSSRCFGICQYDRRSFDADILMEILRTHPKVLEGRKIFDNARMYFLPPEEFLGGDRQNALLERYLANLAEPAVDA